MKSLESGTPLRRGLTGLPRASNGGGHALARQGAVRGLLGRLYVVVIIGFLYLPVAIMALMSLNASPLFELPIHFTFDWYRAAIGDSQLMDAALRSVKLAVSTMVLSTALGVMAALAFYRYEFPGKRQMQALLFPPMAIPWLITGTAMLIFFFSIGIGRGLHAILLGHVALALPYVIIVVGARLKTFPIELEQAARSLGATGWQITWRVTLPNIAPGIVAGALFAFAVSFDQFVVSYFLSSPGQTTLPVEIYSAIRKGFTPAINAISTLIIMISMGIMVVVSRLYRFGGEQ
ncbi:ABC transporter permease [Burkholderia stagnalis]|uniref:ABC transporter permease n=1 Tax=Burkholderia stagnalis TaxID=1503054 RepID=A0A6L3N008_9BURK|nr:ABC transporter permease [Burkholderia stagnalis]VWB55772.1 putrescine transport system permease [Burkholderia stagnalis]